MGDIIEYWRDDAFVGNLPAQSALPGLVPTNVYSTYTINEDVINFYH
jgi:hypothetical protein